MENCIDFLKFLWECSISLIRVETLRCPPYHCRKESFFLQPFTFVLVQMYQIQIKGFNMLGFVKPYLSAVKNVGVVADKLSELAVAKTAKEIVESTDKDGLTPEKIKEADKKMKLLLAAYNE